MGVLILNSTGNREGFEDHFCRTLEQLLATVSVRVVSGRGYDLLDRASLNGEQVVVLVSHAAPQSDGSETYLDLGFDPSDDPSGLLNSPTVFAQILGRSRSPFIIVYCCCEALSPETGVSGVEDPHCRGVIACSEAVMDTHVSLVADLVTSVQVLFAQHSPTDDDIHRAVREVRSRWGSDHPNPWYLTAPRVQWEDE